MWSEFLNNGLIVFALALIVAQFVPGPDFALVTRASLVYGARYGVYCALGIGTALLFHTSVIAFGGSYLLKQNDTLTRCILAVSAVWILYLAWKSWPRKKKQPEGDSGEGRELPSRKSLYFQAGITNLLNPKCFIFVGVLAAPLLRPGNPSWYPLAIIIIAVGQAVVLWAAWSYLLRLGPLERIFTRHHALIDRVFSILFTCFACGVLYQVIFWSPNLR